MHQVTSTYRQVYTSSFKLQIGTCMRGLVGLCIYPRLHEADVSLEPAFIDVLTGFLVFVHTRPHRELFDRVFLAFDILDTLMQETVGEFGNRTNNTFSTVRFSIRQQYFYIIFIPVQFFQQCHLELSPNASAL